MAAMDAMFANMINKALPPQLAHLLTPEGMEKLGNQVGVIVSDLHSTLRRLEANDQAILNNQEAICAHLGIPFTRATVSDSSVATGQHDVSASGGGDGRDGGQRNAA